MIAVVLLAVAAGGMAFAATFWSDRQNRLMRDRAYDEIAVERGVRARPGETTKQALRRARREDSLHPVISLEAVREARQLSGMRPPPMPKMRPRIPSRLR